jgi:hypothetical protein
MIPRWQLISLGVLVLATIALAIYASPNSYAHMFLTGRCFGHSQPTACHAFARGFGPRSRATP